jgi:hypothetical protein
MVLRCEECNALCDYGAGWIAYLLDDEEDRLQDSCVVVYCPTCAAREFGFASKRKLERSIDAFSDNPRRK